MGKASAGWIRRGIRKRSSSISQCRIIWQCTFRLVDVCDNNAANSVDDCVVTVRGVGVKGEGAGGSHTEISGAAVRWVVSVLGE